MKLKNRSLGVLAGLFLTLFAVGTALAVDRPRTEGAVMEVSSVKTGPGKFLDYMAWLDGLHKKLMDQQKASPDTVSRGKLRTQLGSELIRELKSK